MIWLYILLTLFVLGILTFVHELGHFSMARAFGVTIKEFAIGMGPKLFSWKSKKYDTKYALRLFPIGGFVAMAGEDEESDDENSFDKKKVWQRFLILCAGPFMNLLIGFIAMTILVLNMGTLRSTKVKEFAPDAPSEKTGLMINDKILKIDGVKVHTDYQVYYEIMHSGIKPIDILVERNGQKHLVEGVMFETFSESGATFGDPDFNVFKEDFNFTNVVKHSYFRSIASIKMVWDSLVDLVTGRYGIEAISGPVGMTEAVGEAASSGFLNFLFLFVIISMNLGVFNLLPIPALDGSRLVFLALEGIRGKPIKKEVESYIHMAGLLILFGFMILITFKDVIGLFK